MKLTVPELKINDNEGFSTEKDLFNRKQFGVKQHRNSTTKCVAVLVNTKMRCSGRYDS